MKELSTKYKGTFYDYETENGAVKTNLRETPKLMMQSEYQKPVFNQDQVASLIADVLIKGAIDEDTYLNFINQYQP